MSNKEDWLNKKKPAYSKQEVAENLAVIVQDLKTSRNYNLPNSEVIGVPTWEPAKNLEDGLACPTCGANLCLVRVKVKQKLVTGGEGISNYMGCPACPFASPAMIITTAGNADE